MATGLNFILFGEGDPLLRPRLHSQVIESRTDPYLHLFFERASSALRHFISQLPRTERRKIPAFSTVEELNESSNAGTSHAGVQGALNCIFAISNYIKYILLSKNPILIMVLSIPDMPEPFMVQEPLLQRLVLLGCPLVFYRPQLWLLRLLYQH